MARFQCNLSSLKCNREVNETTREAEFYVIITAVQLLRAVDPLTLPAPFLFPKFDVNLYNPDTFQNMAAGETHLVDPTRFPPFLDIRTNDPAFNLATDAIVIATLMEQDSGNPRVLTELIAGSVARALSGTFGSTRKAIEEALISAIKTTIGQIGNMGIPMAFDDDHVGTLALQITDDNQIPDLFPVLLMEGGQNDYTLQFIVRKTELQG